MKKLNHWPDIFIMYIKNFELQRMSMGFCVDELTSPL